ncbi:protein LEG1 homolog [Salvelinus alpinus]|uniref:protein LEG1 homolog n=1 Tax=Salvelinus sp. IW2-2015 TaxID=2691554 RepID=UPI000CDFD91A|nr:protein LEG1 homolog [Salvelinus alpinus]XP_023855508.1 protein LEG1 homolog [Salvelinus alpinus]
MQCVWTLSLLQLVALWANAAVLTENGLPILWDQAPSQLSDLPQADNVVTINPWNALQRMSLYRILVGSTDKYMASMGTNDSASPLWGLPLQLAWKLRSGRLVDPTGDTICGQEGDPMCISTNSWWACVNYYLSVIPFLAAVQKGLIGDGLIQVQVQAPAEAAEDYCTSYTDCSAKNPDLMAKWEEFFQTLKDVSASEISDFEKRDQILGAFWAGETLSLNTASSSCKAKMSYYSSPEVAFAKSWMNAADYVAAAYFQSSLNNSVLFMRPLPSRVLQEGDSAPNIADLSTEENHNLYIFGWMARMNTILLGSPVKMWRSAMCSDKAREKGRELLQNLILDPKFAVSTFVSILTEMTRSCSGFST